MLFASIPRRRSPIAVRMGSAAMLGTPRRARPGRHRTPYAHVSATDSGRPAGQHLQESESVGPQLNPVVRRQESPLPAGTCGRSQEALVRAGAPAVLVRLPRCAARRRFEPLFDHELPIGGNRRLDRPSQGPRPGGGENSAQASVTGACPGRRSAERTRIRSPIRRRSRVVRSAAPRAPAASAVELELQPMNRALNRVDAAGPRRDQYVRCLAAAIAKRA